MYFFQKCTFQKSYKRGKSIELSLMDLYFLDDGSLIIAKSTSIQLIEEVEIVRTIGCHRFSGLSGKEAFDILVKNFLQDNGAPDRLRDKENKCQINENK